MPDYGTRALFEELNDGDFATYGDLERKVIELFNRHLAAFPPGYSYRDAIALGRRTGWVQDLGRGRFKVQIRKRQEPVSAGD